VITAVFDMTDPAMTNSMTNSMTIVQKGEQQARKNMEFSAAKKTAAEAALAAHKETLEGIKKAAGKGTWRERVGKEVDSHDIKAA
jgi:hypothetical protein